MERLHCLFKAVAIHAHQEYLARVARLDLRPVDGIEGRKGPLEDVCEGFIDSDRPEKRRRIRPGHPHDELLVWIGRWPDEGG